MLVQIRFKKQTKSQVVSSRKIGLLPQFWYPMECVEYLEYVTSLVTKVTQKSSFVFKHLCKYCIVLDTQGSDDV